MRVTVFGANGKVGRLVVDRLINNEYEVVAFVHSQSSFTETEKLKIVQGDVHNLNDVKLAIKDSDVIISTLGSWGTKQKDIVSSGVINIIGALKAGDTKRVITLTGADALTKEEKVSLLNKVLHSLIKLSPAKRILFDGEKHISLLESSNLNWTVVRSPVMNNKGEIAKYTFSNAKPKLWETINRASVADAIIKLINEESFSRRAPFIKRS